MLNISTTTAVSWPTPLSTAVAPVSPVAPVQSEQASGGGNNQAQTGFGRDGRAPQQPGVGVRVAPEARAAAAADGTAREPGEAPVAPGHGGAATAHDQVAQRQTREAATKAAEQQQAKDKKAVEHLQQVLSNMWEASADVVNRALGIDPPNTDALGNQSDTAPDLSSVAAALIPRKPVPAQLKEKPALEPLPWPVMPEAADGGEDMFAAAEVDDPRTAEVVAYDERGNSSLAPLEAGSLISHRV